MMNCLLSIVTITRNDCPGLSKTLDSVREQNYQHIEHIVVDGNSSDGTKELLATYAHSKAFTYCSEPDNGISDAFNKGLERSQGRLIFFLNSGDVFATETIVAQVIESYLEHRWKCAEGSTLTVGYSGEEIVYVPPKLPSHFLHYFMFLPHQGFFCETALHKHHRFDESIKTSMDYDILLRMLPNLEIFYLPFVVAKRLPGGVSSQSVLRITEHAHIRSKYAKTFYDKAIVGLINPLVFLKDRLKINSPFSRKWKVQ